MFKWERIYVPHRLLERILYVGGFSSSSLVCSTKSIWLIYKIQYSILFIQFILYLIHSEGNRISKSLITPSWDIRWKFIPFWNYYVWMDKLWFSMSVKLIVTPQFLNNYPFRARNLMLPKIMNVLFPSLLQLPMHSQRIFEFITPRVKKKDIWKCRTTTVAVSLVMDVTLLSILTVILFIFLIFGRYLLPRSK